MHQRFHWNKRMEWYGQINLEHTLQLNDIENVFIIIYVVKTDNWC